MTWLWLAIFALTATVVVALILPLVRRRRDSSPPRAEYDLSVYRDQLAEVDRDLARGLLAEAEAESARTEVKRRMLLAANEADASADRPAARPSHAAAAVVGVAIPLATLALYLALGNPRTPDMPLAARQTNGAGDARLAQNADPGALTMEQAVAQLAARLESRPDDLQGWILLARSYASMERYADAAEALKRAVELSAGDADLTAHYGEALTAAAGGTVTPPARLALEQALAADPSNPVARFYLALARAQDGDLEGALQGWVDLLAIAPAGAPWIAPVQAQAERAASALGIQVASVMPSPGLPIPEAAEAPSATAPGPSRADVEAAAAMSPEERETMIRGMVANLAARLEESPDDLEGWRRLARAYDVLGETEKAAGARARVTALENR